MEVQISDTRKLVWKKREIQIHKLCTAKTDTVDHKEGEEYWKSYSYCATINGALRVLLAEGLANNSAKGVDECIEAVYDECRKLEEVINKCNFTTEERNAWQV